jgi:zinc protease
VGSFDLPTMKPLVERYLASLPALHRQETGRDVGMRPPAGIVEKQVTKGREPKGQVGVVFTGAFQNDPQHRLLLRAVADTLEGNLQRVLREELGGTYGVSVEPDFTKRPAEEYRVMISFTCDPARTQDLIKAMFWVIEQLKTSGPSEGHLADVRAGLVRDLEINSRRNEYVLNQLAYAYEYGEAVPDDARLRQMYEQLTPPMVRDAAQTYLDTNRYVKVVLVPEA